MNNLELHEIRVNKKTIQKVSGAFDQDTYATPRTNNHVLMSYRMDPPETNMELKFDQVAASTNENLC